MLIRMTLDGRASDPPVPDEEVLVNSRFLVSASPQEIIPKDLRLPRFGTTKILVSVGAQAIQLFVREKIWDIASQVESE